MRELRRNYDARAKDMGLTMSRARALTTLAGMEGTTQTALAAKLEIETPTLKRQLDALEASGFVERRPLECDARKNALFLTPQAHDSGIVEFTRRLRAEVLEGIGRDDLDRTQQVLERMLGNVARLTRDE
ncbi:MarR family transcriptional regulator [Paracoccus sp. 11-3]|uniref:MarR family transcriptional regulator n=2 Tax=Paracoccus amoyensis TaxID=2760093 RepID=A0A926GEB0_9RHOB|nr:MarR family transcriptional regulator [Paracoccus amoyensis]MBC9248466.1 MarR family transcriptional regulator [Paracoccus amoyensis]